MVLEFSLFASFYFLHQCLDTDVRNNGLRSNLVLKCIMSMPLMSIKKQWVAINVVVKSVKLHIAAVYVQVLMTTPQPF